MIGWRPEILLRKMEDFPRILPLFTAWEVAIQNIMNIAPASAAWLP
jgi:hypothetical protein